MADDTTPSGKAPLSEQMRPQGNPANLGWHDFFESLGAGHSPDLRQALPRRVQE
jgi:hypothetical protein